MRLLSSHNITQSHTHKVYLWLWTLRSIPKHNMDNYLQFLSDDYNLQLIASALSLAIILESSNIVYLYFA